MAASYVVLWRLGSLTITSALIAATVTTTTALMLGMTRSIRRIGIGRPDLRLGLHTLWYGIRGHGTLIATNVNARLDVAMLPAFVVASSVGLYSVATNVSLIIYQLSNTFAALLLPAAARDPERGPTKILGSLYATIAIAGALALAVALFARPLLGLVYGSQLILPGAVLFAGSSIMSAGVYAAGHPFTASLAQVFGIAVTVIGLSVFLRSGGITAAAVISSVSYATVFVATVVAYKFVAGVPWRWFVPTPARIRSLAA
jgi:O-antigen/teichoic acid export membrane protein